MAITSAIATSFKQQVLVEGHNLTNGADSIKLALYTSSATMGAATTAYSTAQEVSGTNYSAGGSALTNVTYVPLILAEIKHPLLEILQLCSQALQPQALLFV